MLEVDFKATGKRLFIKSSIYKVPSPIRGRLPGRTHTTSRALSSLRTADPDVRRRTGRSCRIRQDGCGHWVKWFYPCTYMDCMSEILFRPQDGLKLLLQFFGQRYSQGLWVRYMLWMRIPQSRIRHRRSEKRSVSPCHHGTQPASVHTCSFQPSSCISFEVKFSSDQTNPLQHCL